MRFLICLAGRFAARLSGAPGLTLSVRPARTSLRTKTGRGGAVSAVKAAARERLALGGL